MLGECNRPAVAHAEQVIEKIGHPKNSAPFLSFDKICLVVVCSRKCILVRKVYLMQTHYLDQTECSSSTHPRFLVECPHRLECGNQDPSLDLFTIYGILPVITEAQRFQNLFRILIQRLLKVSKLDGKKGSERPHGILQAYTRRFLLAVFGPG